MLRTVFENFPMKFAGTHGLEKWTHETMLVEGLFTRPQIVVKIEFDVYPFDLM